MDYTYMLTHGRHTIKIISNVEGTQHEKGRLVIKYLSIELARGRLIYWTGGIRKIGFTDITLEPGKPYEHIFEDIKIVSKDQNTFYVKI